MSKRDFRTPISYESERITRDMLTTFFGERGFADVRDERKNHGRNESQIIRAITPEGQQIAMSVRICWRRGRTDVRGTKPYSAAQILAKIKDNDWVGTLQRKIDREAAKDVTHFLLVQREEARIVFAALVPLSELIPVWCEQRDISSALITERKIRKKKNHAMNGSSPTIWLQDDRAPEVAIALWTRPGVQDIAKLPLTDPTQAQRGILEFRIPEELPDGVAYTEGSARRVLVNRYERDPKARQACLSEYGTKCFVCEFDFAVRYGKTMDGFIHVHHLLPISTVGSEYKVDPVRDLRPICPNCHAVIHHAREPLTIEAVRVMLQPGANSRIS